MAQNNQHLQDNASTLWFLKVFITSIRYMGAFGIAKYFKNFISKILPGGCRTTIDYCFVFPSFIILTGMGFRKFDHKYFN